MPSFEVKDGNFTLVIHVGDALDILAFEQLFFKLNAKRILLRKGYSVEMHSPTHSQQGPGCQKHIHVYLGDNQLYAINKDGSAHDQSHGKCISKRMKEKLARHFPDFTFPHDGIIKYTPQNQLYCTDKMLVAIMEEIERSGKISAVYALRIDLDKVVLDDEDGNSGFSPRIEENG